MASASNARTAPPQDATKPSEPRLLWNSENVKDVAESVGIGNLSEEALRTLSQDVEYRIGQVIIEALRFMRISKRTTMSVQDVAQALKVLDVEPLYGYESTRSLRYGEASLGPGQPLFYIEDEEVDFEKLINSALPKVPRDATFTSHWLAIEGVQPTVPQNPSTNEARSQELLPKGPGANPALPALAGNQGAILRPAVKHIISTELTLYFEKIQAAVLDDNPDPEVERLREAALASVASDPGIHQLVPYFVQFISNEVTHHLDDVFVLRRSMELTFSLVSNPHLHLDPYAPSLATAVLTCLLARKLGTEGGIDAVKEHYQLREYSSSLIGKICEKYTSGNHFLKPRVTRTCLRSFLDPKVSAAVWYGAILGISSAGGPSVVECLTLPNLKDFESHMLQKHKDSMTEAKRVEFDAVLGAIVRTLRTLVPANDTRLSRLPDGPISERQSAELKDFLGEIISEKVVELGDHRLVQAILEARSLGHS